MTESLDNYIQNRQLTEREKIDRLTWAETIAAAAYDSLCQKQQALFNAIWGDGFSRKMQHAKALGYKSVPPKVNTTIDLFLQLERVRKGSTREDCELMFQQIYTEAMSGSKPDLTAANTAVNGIAKINGHMHHATGQFVTDQTVVINGLNPHQVYNSYEDYEEKEGQEVDPDLLDD